MSKALISAELGLQSEKTVQVYCGELCKSDMCSSTEINLLNEQNGDMRQTIVVGLAQFVMNPHSLSDRVLDLLQIAAYVHCADRLANRGDRKSISNKGWARSFNFHIPVLDLEFWNQDRIKRALNEALIFVTGDRRYTFEFTQAMNGALDQEKAQLSLFSKEYISIDDAKKTDIMLFSGGLDSLAGAIERLEEYQDRKLCLVTHKSNKMVEHNQKKVREYLERAYPDRILHYIFECHNTKFAPSSEETQRTRMFLFSAIAFAIAFCYDKKELYIYENGVTSLNLPKQGDIMNGKASRTTHPKTLALLQNFYRLIVPDFKIIAPYYNKTKAEVIERFTYYHHEKIISSAISCSASRNHSSTVPHCGKCSQCIDRVFAMYAVGLDEYDSTYTDDVIDNIPDAETNQRIYNTLRMASHPDIRTVDDFMARYCSDVLEIVEYWPEGNNPEDSLGEVFDLFNRYGDSVLRAAARIRSKRENLGMKPNRSSLLTMLNDRTYLETPYAVKAEEISRILSKAIPLAFQRELPQNENDFNDKLQSILSGHGEFTREYPSIQFGLTAYKADQAVGKLLIESKYIRKGTTPSAAVTGIAADITEIPDEYGILFVVFDPHRQIKDDEKYISSLENKRNNCYVRVFR